MRGVRTLLLTCGTAATLVACGGGGGGGATPTATPAPTPTPTPAPTALSTTTAADPLVLAAAIFNGHSTGTWYNDRFYKSGSIVSDVTVDPAAKTVSFHVVLGGNVFGAPAPSPQLFVGKIAPSPSGNGFTITGTSPFLGPFTITVTTDGKITVNCPSVPGGHVTTMTATGTVTDPKSLKLSYSVTLSDGSTASGTATLTKS